MTFPRARFLPAIAALMLLGGCAGTSYVSYNSDMQMPESTLSSSVAYEVTPAFYRSPPECVVIRPFGDEGKTSGVGYAIERALARYIYEKVDRVIGPKERNQAANRLGVDARSTDGLDAILSHFRCDFVIRSTPIGDNGVYAVFWAQARVGLQVQLEHERRGTILWRARHIATRSEGGFPLSPIGVAVNAFWAAQFQSNKEEFDTLIDDAARRIFRTFPEVKRFNTKRQARYSGNIKVKIPR